MIRTNGYHKWNGTLKENGFAWLPVFCRSITEVYHKRFSKLLFFVTSSVFFVFLGGIYVALHPKFKVFSELTRAVSNDSSLFFHFYTNGFLMFMLLLLTIFAGGHLISNDIKYNAFSMYFSRPITVTDYICGKFLSVFAWLMLFTALPGILLLIFKFMLSGEFTFTIPVIAGVLVFPLVYSYLLSSSMLLFSSMSKDQRIPKIAFFMFYMGTNMVGYSMAGGTNQKIFMLVSIDANIKNFAATLFNQSPVMDVSGWVSGVLLVLLSSVMLFLLSHRLKKREA